MTVQTNERQMRSINTICKTLHFVLYVPFITAISNTYVW